uniref:Uncharacterized protein n=1 Tax=Parastrongyloides trichosuri TaxID=131310 RepID=A0A0N5A6V0_PARTI
MCPQCRAPSSERDIKKVYCQDSLNYSFIEFCLQNYKNLQENTLTEVERDINKVVIQQLNSLYSKKFEELKDFTISITRRSFEYFELSNPNKIIEELKAKINKKFYVIKRMVENDVITIINQMNKGKTKNDTLKKKLSDLRLIHKHVMNENKNLNTIHSLAQKYKKIL